MARVGQIYTLDALLATALIVSATLLLLQAPVQQSVEVQTQYAANDVAQSLASITLGSQNTALITEILNQTTLTANDSLLYAIGLLWAINDSRADDIALYVNQTIPQTMGVRVRIQDDQLFERAKPNASSTSTAFMQVTGIAQGAPSKGTSSTAYLNRVRDKQTSTYALYGGFIGQGNITQQLTLPSDVSNDSITFVQIEADIASEMNVYINELYCDTFTPTTPAQQPDVFNATTCKNLFHSGTNNILFTFSNLSQAYLAGGFVRVDYVTDTLSTPNNLTHTIYEFPQIVGQVNVYDSITIPQTLTNLDARIIYNVTNNDTQTYLSIGEKVVYTSTGNGSFDVTLSDENFSILDYEYLSNKTVPIRLASLNTKEILVDNGNADVVLVTDYSGSMKKSVFDWGQGNSGNVRDCEEVYADTDIRRTHLARCLDKEVVSIIHNVSGNRLYPTHFVGDELFTYYNPTDQESLMGYYETYTSDFPQQGSGKTCLSCALSQAYNIFSSESDENRSKFVILMSDGLPTHCTQAGCGDEVSAEYGSLICQGACDVQGQNCGSWQNMCTDTSCSLAINNTLQLAKRLKDDFNVTVHTVGFGPVGTCSEASQTLLEVAELTNGTYIQSNDPLDLRDAYQEISYTILDAIEFESQTALVAENTSASSLEQGSFIQATHQEVREESVQQRIELTRQSDYLSSCQDTVSIPSEVTITQAVLTSYSGPHWTDYVRVNDQDIFNLTSFYAPYTNLGDPYRIWVAPELITASSNVFIRTADSPVNQTACSTYNSLIYDAQIPAVSSSTPVLPQAQGCTWTIAQEQAGLLNVTIPADYAGTNTCSYTPGNIEYDPSDALQVAVYRLLEQLDFADTGEIFVRLTQEDLSIVLSQVGNVPFLWGPILVYVEVFQ